MQNKLFSSDKKRGKMQTRKLETKGASSMKRRFRAAVLLLLLAALLTTAVFADFGPKPQLIVRVEHAPQEEYYLDLLDEGNYTGDDETDETELDPALLEAFRAAIPAGWHGCISQGSTGAPIWGELTGQKGENGEMLHTFRYFGVPQTYRILIVTQSGETLLSEPLERATLQSTVTVDWQEKTVKEPVAWQAFAVQFLATFVPTILIELAALMLFGFRLKENWKLVLAVNAVTQGLLHGYFAMFAQHNGVSFAYFLLFFPAEAVVTLIETCIYAGKLRGASKRRAVFYAVCANVCSAALGYVLAEPVWQMTARLL